MVASAVENLATSDVTARSDAGKVRTRETTNPRRTQQPSRADEGRGPNRC